MTPQTISLEVKKGMGVQKNPLGPQNPKKLTFWAPKNEKNDFFQKTRILGFDETLGVVPTVALVTWTVSDLLVQFVKPKSCSAPLC